MFISLEGIEGCGKSTQIVLLHQRLLDHGMPVTLTREPGGSELGRHLRALLLHQQSANLTAHAELFLYLADRAQHVAEVIKPALTAGNVVLCDRFTDSTVVYQGYGRGLDPHLLDSLNQVAVEGCLPNLTLILDLPVETGLRRARKRNVLQDLSASEGRFEAESLGFHHRIRAGYLLWAALHPGRCAIVQADLPPEKVGVKIWSLVAPRLGLG
ncbi:MAG TPA: dTMP kinase [Desulfonatronum sp.]|nr:dTMP kinase [Desulfonatronum sp.]